MKTFLYGLLLLATTPSLACDICGSGAGGNYFGILPQFQRNFIGMRMQDRSNLADPSALYPNGYTDRFRTAELWGRWYAGRRWQLMTMLPYQFNRRELNGNYQWTQGLGDAIVLANYILVNTGDSLSRTWKTTILFGGGMQFPTGSTKATWLGMPVAALLQPGGGSMNSLLTANITVRRNKCGVNADLNGRYTSTNNNGYKAGNSMSAALRLFYWQQWGRFAVLPHIGGAAESAAGDYTLGLRIPSGGSMLLTGAGVDVYAGNTAWGLSVQYPVYQDLPGNRVTTPRIRLQCSIAL